jgi:hypothetical protein
MCGPIAAKEEIEVIPKPRWHLEMSFRIIGYGREADSSQNAIDVLHCFAPHPLDISPICDREIGAQDSLLATDGDVVDPVLSTALS